MAFSIANAGAAARGYERGIDMLADRKRQMGIEQRAEERHGIDMDDAQYRQQARLPADTVRGAAMGDIAHKDKTREHELWANRHKEESARPAAEVLASHRREEQDRIAAAARAQNQETRAQQSHASRERLTRLQTEMAETEAALHKRMRPLIEAGKEAEAVQALTDSYGKINETLAASYFELGPKAAVDMLNRWLGSRTNPAVDFRKVETENGTEYAAVDAQGQVITDPMTNQPMQMSEQELKGWHGRYQARNAPKDGTSQQGKKARELMAAGVPEDIALSVGYGAVREVKDVVGNVTLIDTITNQPRGTMRMDDNGDMKWTPAGEGGAAAAPPQPTPQPTPQPPPNPAIGEGPRPPQNHLDVLREAMNAGDPALRQKRQQQFDAKYGQGAAMHWMSQIDQQQRGAAAQQQQQERQQQEQQQAVQQAQGLLKAVDGAGIAQRGPNDPPSEVDAQFVEFFEANRAVLEAADKGMVLEMLPAYRNAKARLKNVPKGIDPATQARDAWMGGIDAPSVPGVVLGGGEGAIR